MTALSAQYTLSQNATVQQAIRMAMVYHANIIVGESSEPTLPVKHQKRHDLALTVLRDPDYWLMRFVYSTIANDVLAGSPTDIQIKSEVLVSFDRIAGVDAIDLIPQ